jgi:hypothetical protein
MSTNFRNDAARSLIPGAYDRTTLTHRQPGSMGGAAYGSPDMPVGPSSMDAATIAERELEGGGGASERHRTVKRDPALANGEPNESLSTGGHRWFQLLRLARR